MIRVIIIREGIDAEGNPISDVRVRGRDGDNFERLDLLDMPETFDAARHVLLDSVSDEQIMSMPSFIDRWQAGLALRPGQLVLHEDIVYRVQQAHTTQADWMPGGTPALFRALGTEDEAISSYPLWIQPTGGHDAYNRGDRVTYNGIRFESTIGANVWAPSVWGWIAV